MTISHKFSIHGNTEALEILGRRLRAHRLQRNWTQAHLASIAGISLPTYGRVEKGDPTVAFGHVMKVAAILGFARALQEAIPEPQPQTIVVEKTRQRAFKGRRDEAR